jgi:hypothetical protein
MTNQMFINQLNPERIGVAIGNALFRLSVIAACWKYLLS